MHIYETRMLKRKLENPTVEAFLCSVCRDLPRGIPIYNCSRGHIICETCLPHLINCPLCRCPNIKNRNPFAERLLTHVISVGLPVDCKNKENGCSVTDTLSKVGEHEKVCVYREVQCPARHRGACKWIGPLCKMLLHVVDEKCAQIVKSKEDNKPFVSVIGDFNSEGITVFGRNAMTHWKPVLLISRQYIRLFAYLVMYRDERGNWIIYLRSFASDAALDMLEADVKISKPSKARFADEMKTGTNFTDQNNKDNNNCYTFTGRIMPQKYTEQQVIDTGNYLCLKDSQIKKLGIGRTLFEYSVNFKEIIPTNKNIKEDEKTI